MDLLRVIIASLVSAIVLLILSKLLGYRQIAQLTVFDYINAVTIGSIAAEISIAPTFKDAGIGLIAMTIFVLFTLALEIMTNKSRRFRNLISGQETPLMINGKLSPDGFKKTKLDLNEFLMCCHTAGYFRLAELWNVSMETNGSFSFMPRAAYHPVTPADLSLSVPAVSVPVPVIQDGEVIGESLSQLGKDTAWLEASLRSNGIKSVKDVFYAEADCAGNFNLY